MTEGKVIVALVLAFVAAVVHPLLLVYYGRKEGLRWMRNDPATNLFLVVVLPLAIATFVRAFDVAALAEFGSILGAAVLAVLLTSALAFTCMKFFGNDASKHPPLPFWVRNCDEALSEDSKVRKELKEPLRTLLESEKPAQHEELVQAFHDRRKRSLERYLRTARPFERCGDFLRQGSLIAYYDFFLVFGAASFVCLFFWSTLVSYAQSKTVPESTMVILGLLLVWIPSKLYSEWYQHYYSLRELRTRWVFWIIGLGAVGFSFMVLTAYAADAWSPTVVIPAVLGAIGAILSIIAKSRPQWIWYMAEVYEDMPAFPYLFLLFAFALMLWASVLSGWPAAAASRR